MSPERGNRHGTIRCVQRPYAHAVRGTLRLHIEESDLDAVRRPDAREHLAAAAVSLSALRKKLRRGHGAIVDPFGDTHPLSLSSWATREPETRITIYFTYQQHNLPEGFRGSIFPLDVLSLVRVDDSSSP